MMLKNYEESNMKWIKSILRFILYSPVYLVGLVFSIFKKKPKFGSGSRIVLVENVAGMLKIQKTVSGNSSIEDSNGRPNRKAMGYIYGFTDAALQSIGQDIRDISIGMPTVFGVFCALYPGKELQYTDFLLDHINQDAAIMAGVTVGGQQYLDLAKHNKTPMQFGMFLLEGDNYDEMLKGSPANNTHAANGFMANSVSDATEQETPAVCPPTTKDCSVIILPYSPTTSE